MIFSLVLYLVTFAAVFAINYYSSKTKNKKIRILLIATSFVMLSLLIGLRLNVGTDYNSYIADYEKIRAMSWGEAFSYRMEPFIVILYKTMSYIFAGWPYWIFIMYGVMALLPVYLANKVFNYKYLALSVLAFCLLYVPFIMNGMRQGVAVGFVLLSIALLSKSKTKLAIVSLIPAFLFHMSSLIVLPFLIVYLVCKKIKKSYCAASLILAAIILCGIFVFGNTGLYGGYLAHASISSLSFKSLIAYFPIIVLAINCERKNVKNTIKEGGSGVLMSSNILCGICFQVIGTIAPFVNRLAFYFIPSFIFLAPIYLGSINNKRNRNIVMVIYVLYLLAFFIVEYVVWGRNNIIPYLTWV